MFKKIKKMARYIADFKRNRNLLNALNEGFTFSLYLNHYKLSEKYTNCRLDAPEKMLSEMVISYHSIEKGLAMNGMRLGFGQPKMKKLVALCNEYLNANGDYPTRLLDTIGVIAEYDQLHKKNGYALNKETQNEIDSLLLRINREVSPSHTQQMTADRYFGCSDSNFGDFSVSRHSVRDFTGDPIPEETMNAVFQLAQKAPSACNRQSVRVYAVYDEQKRRKLVDLQNHERGFADRANPLLVITTELQDWGFGEQWFGGYLDSGIYLMNLLYALHYHKVAAVPLNWYADAIANKEIHTLLNIPDSQVVVAFVGCGFPINEFKLVTSKRRNANEIVTVV